MANIPLGKGMHKLRRIPNRLIGDNLQSRPVADGTENFPHRVNKVGAGSLREYLAIAETIGTPHPAASLHRLAMTTDSTFRLAGAA